jgi:hypothetical protein
MASNVLSERLALAFEWYRGMVSPETGRLAYEYHPVQDKLVVDGHHIRDIAAVWDLAILSEFLDRSELRPVIETSLEHYTNMLVHHGSGSILDPRQLGEPSSIAHSAFLALALLASRRTTPAVGIVDAIVDQQRDDGSYRIYFGHEPDEGLDLYPGEAMLAVLEAYIRSGDGRYLLSAERGFAFHRDRRPAYEIDPQLLVFYANWQAQYGSLLHAHTRSSTCRAEVRDYICSLLDHVLRSGYFDRIERSPDTQATVEVACALEGISDAYAIAQREHDSRRMDAYARATRIALSYLLRAQRPTSCSTRERGGYGNTIADRTQRIDVTGHVVAGFIKALRNGITM